MYKTDSATEKYIKELVENSVRLEAVRARRVKRVWSITHATIATVIVLSVVTSAVSLSIDIINWIVG